MWKFSGFRQTCGKIPLRMLCGLLKPTSASKCRGFDVYAKREINATWLYEPNFSYGDLTVSENSNSGADYTDSQSEINRNAQNYLARYENGEALWNLYRLAGTELSFSVSIIITLKFCSRRADRGVDPLQEEILGMIYSASRQGITIFVTTHYMDEAEYCDRVSIMVDGKISAIGSPSALKKEFNQGDMGGAFKSLARKSQRKAD